MKLYATFVATICISAATQSAELEPLASRDSVTNKSWGNESSEFAYVTARCDVLMASLGGYLMENGSRPEDQVSADKFLAKSKFFRGLSIVTSVDAGMDNKNILDRSKIFFEFYGARMRTNKLANNNVFDSLILGDIKFCNDAQEMLTAFAKSQKAPKKPAK